MKTFPIDNDEYITQCDYKHKLNDAKTFHFKNPVYYFRAGIYAC